MTPGAIAAGTRVTARAILVDAQREHAARRAGRPGSADAAEEAASAEQQAAARAFRIDSDVCRETSRAPSRGFVTFRRARREIVIVSDAQRGATGRGRLAAVPADIGMRFIEVGDDGARTHGRPFPALGAAGLAARNQQVTLAEDATRVALQVRGSSAVQGLQLVTCSARSV